MFCLVKPAIASLIAFHLYASASLPILDNSNDSDRTPDLENQSREDIVIDGIYRAQKSDTEVGLLAIKKAGTWIPFASEETILLGNHEVVHARQMGDGNVLLTLLVDETADPQTPRQVLVSIEDFGMMNLAFAQAGDSDLLAGYSVADSLASLPGSPSPQRFHRRGRMMTYTINGRFSARGCLGYVQRAIHWNRPVHVGKHTANFLHILLKSNLGYHRVDCDSAKEGAIGGWSGPHVAIMQGGCWRYDRGCGDPGRGYGRLYICVSR